MRLRDVASKSFVLIRADASVATARRRLEGTTAIYVVVEGRAADVFYLILLEAVRSGLDAAAPGAKVEVALDLAHLAPTPVLSGDLRASPPSTNVIVVDDGKVRGFLERQWASAKPPMRAEPPPVPANGGPPPASRGLDAPVPDPGEPPTSRGLDVPVAANGGPAPVRRNGGSRPAEANGGPAPSEPPRRTRRGGPLTAPLATAAGPEPAAAPGPAAGPGAAPVERSLEAEFPEKVRLDSVAWLLVYIATKAPTARGLGLGPEMGPGETIDLLIQPRTGFELEGEDDRGTLTVPASGESLPLQFKLKAVKEGPGVVRVVAFHKGEPLGIIDLEAVVESATAPRVRGSAARAPRKAKPLAPPSPQLADLTMYVDQFQDGGKTKYTILLNGVDPALDLNLRTFGPFTLELDPAHFFEEFFKEIDELPLDTPQQQDLAERRLADKGAYLAETLMPADLREKLWEVRDRITSIIVQSEEPWIPWELCRLSGRENGRIVAGPFLCEAYAITRWLPGSGLKRPLSLRNVALVVPDDSGLPLSGPERDYLLSLAGPKRKVTALPATFAKVQDAFIEGVYDGFHFTGHGAARDENPDRSKILLAAGEEFTPESLSGAALNVGVTHPVVFINACQVGRGGMGLTGIGGWANRFVQAGAGAFVGAYWSVIDEAAFEFAKELYTRLLAGMPIGQAVRDARVAIRSPGDPTWLAYTVFADPMATVSA